MSGPDLSVIIATRDGASTLEQTLASLQRQQIDKESYEVIVVNNGGNDNTEPLLARCRRMNIFGLYESKAGKSRAYGRGHGVCQPVSKRGTAHRLCSRHRSHPLSRGEAG